MRKKGNFFGIGQKFKNCEKLLVKSIGGKGGAGQNGGDGMYFIVFCQFGNTCNNIHVIWFKIFFSSALFEKTETKKNEKNLFPEMQKMMANGKQF